MSAIKLWKASLLECFKIPDYVVSNTIITYIEHEDAKGRLHNIWNPARIEYHKNGVIYNIIYYYEDKMHRFSYDNTIQEPAEYYFDPQGNLIRTSYVYMGENHRILRKNKQQPSEIYYDKDGQVISLEYWYNGKLHRMPVPGSQKGDGPAMWRLMGNCQTLEEYYLFGRKLSEDTYYEYLDKLI